jgi:hypothetical protein
VDCTALSAELQQSYTGESYRVTCGLDLLSGSGRLDSDGNTVTLADIVGIVVYDFVDCIQACSIFSQKQQARGEPGGSCWAVSFGVDMSAVVDKTGGNCWLKNSTIKIDDSTSTCQGCRANDVIISAIRTTSASS